MKIKSQLDALRLKGIEKDFYKYILKNSNDEKIIPKVTPFLGINTDAVYIKDNKIIFIKFMDTSEELFSILEEELIEVMNEEYIFLNNNMNMYYSDISFNYVFIMPNVEVENSYNFSDFVCNNIIDKNKLRKIFEDKSYFDFYLSDENNEVKFSIFITKICPEYFVLNENLHINKSFKKISFYDNNYKYSAVMLEDSQIFEVCSINYNNTIYEGSYSTGKTTLAFSKIIKLSRIYPHHKFLFLTNKKQKCIELIERLNIMYPDCKNIQIHTINSFVINLAKKLNLFIDYNLLKKDYKKSLTNLVKQIKNKLNDKKIFKGIFIDNIENFSKEEIDFVEGFLYKNKYIYNVFYSRCGNISNKFSVFDKQYQNENKIYLNKNYRSSKNIVNFINNFSKISNDYLKNITTNNEDIFYETKAIKDCKSGVNIIKVNDLEEQIESIIWEINYLITNKGLSMSDICVVYPYNKKKLKNKNTIYFQYILKKELEKSNISYLQVEDSLTNISNKNGITISNIYSLGDLEYRAIIFCELEMFYNHKLFDNSQKYQINDFFGDLNKIYLCINKACDYLSIITTFDEENSDIIKIINSSNK